MSLLYRLLCRLLGLLVRRGGERELEIIILRHQLAILKRGRKRPHYTTVDRALLAAASRLLPPERWSSLLVRPETLGRWHRTLMLEDRRGGRRRVGRPPLAKETRSLIERLARENSGWGYMRIQGELKGLGISVSATTVANVLRSNGLGPAPRRTGPSWQEFLRAQAESLIGGGLHPAVADGLDTDAAALSQSAADRPVPRNGVDERCAPTAQPRSHAQPPTRPGRSVLAPPHKGLTLRQPRALRPGPATPRAPPEAKPGFRPTAEPAAH
jgi:hypothetical protein